MVTKHKTNVFGLLKLNAKLLKQKHQSQGILGFRILITFPMFRDIHTNNSNSEMVRGDDR